MFTTTEQLTAAMSRGNEQAIELFYRQQFDFMVQQARRASRIHSASTRDEAFLLDVVHDAMLRIVRCIKPMQTESHMKNWTRLVVQSCLLDQLRERYRRKRREQTAAVAELFTPADSAAADDSSEAQWLAEQISKLDPQIVRLIEMRYTQGFTLTKIAERFGLSVATIDGRLRRAIEQLREQAAQTFED